MKRWSWAVLVAAVLIAVSLWWVFHSPDRGLRARSGVASKTETTPTPTSSSQEQTNSDTAVAEPLTDSPFVRLTIPYLRQQRFSSQLNELQPYASNSQYDSFLTSYTSEGLRVNALLTQPSGQPPESGWPAVVFLHGYIPPDQYQTTQRYQDYVDSLARSGFVVFKIDLRGHGDSEGEANGAYYSGDYVIDTLHAYSALQNAGFVDANRIGLWGHSMAGNIVLRTMAAKPDIPAGVVWAGAVFTYSDFQDFGIQDSSYQRPDEDSPRRQRRQQLFDQHGMFAADDPFWQQVVPTNYLDDFSGAIQLHHATNDSVVDVRYSENLAEILRATETAYEFHTYSVGGHNLSGAAFGTAMERTVRFLEKHLDTSGRQ